MKTLHPAVHGGILAIRDNQAHMDAIAGHHIQPIDLVRGIVESVVEKGVPGYVRV